MAISKKSMINSSSPKKATSKKSGAKVTKPVAASEKLATASVFNHQQ